MLFFPKNKPRSVAGAVNGMARPARPPAEARAVREAAEIVRQETGLTAVSAISREIARRVTAELAAFIEQGADDLMAAALDRVRLILNPCPFHTLATDPEIDTLDLFITKRIDRLRRNGGRYLNPAESKSEFSSILDELDVTISARYSRNLNQNSDMS